jgi:hypothetical protein
MRNKLSYKRAGWRAATKRQAALLISGAVLFALANVPRAAAGNDAPAWMHALVNAPLPVHDEKTDAVLLYSERNVTVLSADKIKTQVREVYKILRPNGRDYGTVEVGFNRQQKVTSLHGWCIPAQGKDYEVKDKDALEAAPPKIEGGDLVDDVRVKLLRIPAPDPGNIVGYEYELEEQPLVLQDTWYFQDASPARESHYSLQLPAGWEYKSSWLNYGEVKPTQGGNGQWQWVVSDVKEIRPEENMPPFRGIAGHMIVSFVPPGGTAAKGFSSWQEMGRWSANLTSGRRDASPDIKQKVVALTASQATPLAKMKSLAGFVQQDIRYVAIELGIGGFQPHAASEVFLHRYGDCKDKATLMGSMLQEIGVDSYFVEINSVRGAITPDTPAYLGFNHMILAIRLPDGASDASLIATMQDPKLGKLLFFDPTDELTPLGQIRGDLQANYGLLDTPEGGELVLLPKQPPATSSIQRTAKLTLDASGNLKGEVEEIRLGDRAQDERGAMRAATRTADKLKPIEEMLAGSLSSFQLTHSELVNLEQADQPLRLNYSFEAENYAKNAGGLLLVRPRVLGSKSSALLETKETRKFDIEFPGPAKDIDKFEITLPPGYAVDDLPEPVNADYSFASYHSKTEVTGNVIRYTRTYERKEVTVPASQAADLKKFYRIIATDERNQAVLKPGN